ncbi:hypothetical protein GCM10009808_23770 [Microbacterium sediminicola]|uniref:HTH cro/C1-type domain-containing protein n=1 Tax=Microbacterium sediminicola TaxID=415210 RepID=A0ABP4UG45_9MICO
MSTPTPEKDAALSEDLGARLREAREAAGMSMRALARSSGVSQPFLSLVERGQSAPSLSTLYRIAGALGVAPTTLMPAEDAARHPATGTVSYLRHGEGRRLPVADSANSATGVVLSAHPHLEVVEYDVSPGEDLGEWFSSPGILTLTVLSGQLTVEVDGEGAWDLAAGDALTHPSHIPHKWTANPTTGAHMVLSIAR